MKRLVLLCAVLGALVAFAEKAAVDPEKKAEDAAVKACQLAKDKMAKLEACGDEYGQMSAVICSDKESRSTVDVAKLNADCAKKAKAAPKKAPAKKR